ncbi:MAG TPA: hypothetical protein VMM18_15855 [Gemmatimonadaceae bacterium]|nr:hypothetical protein [Gemmatimonadaceae bacterium]
MDAPLISGRAHPRPRVPWLAALPLTALACAYFPSHEDVYIPIPLSIGEARTENGDTSYALAGPGYELIAPRREILAETQHDIEAAARQFQRYFGTTAPLAIVRYLDSLPPVRPGQDTSIASLTERNEVQIPARFAGFQRSGQRVSPVRPGPAAARVWVVEHARRTRAAQATAAQDGPLATRPADDTIRIPAWIASAMVDLIAVSPGQSALARQLWNRRSEMIPLSELFELDRLAPEVAPGRRMGRGAADRAAMRRVQALSFAQFVADREGAEFLGHAAERLFLGETVREVFADAPTLPGDPDELDRLWRDWLVAATRLR